jgi:hypothetical protein
MEKNNKKKIKLPNKNCSCGKQKVKCQICDHYFCPDCEIGGYLDPAELWFCSECKIEIDKEWASIMNENLNL